MVYEYVDVVMHEVGVDGVGIINRSGSGAKYEFE